MAFTARHLSVLAYAQGFTLWHYASRADTLQQIAASGFFGPAEDMLAGGDMMLISAPDGGRAAMMQPDGSGHLQLLSMI